jgi:hypothetical protein
MLPGHQQVHASDMYRPRGALPVPYIRHPLAELSLASLHLLAAGFLGLLDVLCVMIWLATWTTNGRRGGTLVGSDASIPSPRGPGSRTTPHLLHAATRFVRSLCSGGSSMNVRGPDGDDDAPFIPAEIRGHSLSRPVAIDQHYSPISVKACSSIQHQCAFAHALVIRHQHTSWTCSPISRPCSIVTCGGVGDG